MSVDICYHLTPAENLEGIEREGIVANDEGQIFAFTDMLVANTIACNQVGIKNYAVFAILPAGITGIVSPDDVAELSAPWQKIVMQDRIDPEHLLYLGKHKVETISSTPWTYAQWALSGLDRQGAEAIIAEIAQLQREQTGGAA